MTYITSLVNKIVKITEENKILKEENKKLKKEILKLKTTNNDTNFIELLGK